METLARSGMAYPSDLSRAEVERFGAESGLSAPQEGSGEVRFPPELRPAIGKAERARGFDAPARTWRFATPPGPVPFSDRFVGERSYDVGAIAGDFIVWTKQGVPAYQLAVVVDDARQGVNEVVRGDDLLDSAARQLLLYRSLGLGPEPRYTHVPLVRGTDGRRLAKRHGDTRLDHYRQRGIPAERIVGLVAWWCGVTPGRRAMSAREFCDSFRLDTMSRDPITYGPEDEQWLSQGM
jgi:glutamyl-tRNA synthetase